MSDTVIHVENLSKQYKIGPKQPYQTLRDQLTQGAKRLFARPLKRARQEAIWALKDVSFEVQPGEVMGVIGRNGSGKSTLLKVLSRITEPTEGSAEIRGRIGSLLEVGTGFHPELTGRENIYLSGAILGMKKSEIRQKFDEILAFAEVEKFIDTPVKHYSSGMYVRLAFAVAAHLDPEILLVDEVLAVGDALFQKKCLGKMEEVGKAGRTILLVSHNMGMVASLCTRCVLLHEGSLVAIGPPARVIQSYYANGAAVFARVDFSADARRRGDDIVHLLSARLTNANGDVTTEISISESIAIEMDYEVTGAGARLTPNFHVNTAGGVCAFLTTDATIDPRAEKKKEPGVYYARCRIPGNFLNDGVYYVGVVVSTVEKSIVHFYEKDLLSFTVVDPLAGTITRGDYAGPMPGVVRPVLEWEGGRIA
jgi:lipopolysaccharide transport system ATP-binding protein